MCTAASYRTKDLYFGRNLDYEFSYGDEVTITPRNYPFTFRRAGEMRTHYAMIGMAYVAEEYPLYYDAGQRERPVHCRAELCGQRRLPVGNGRKGQHLGV